MNKCKLLLLVTFIFTGCDGEKRDEEKQWNPPSDTDFIDITDGEVPEFKTAVDRARASTTELARLIEETPDSNIHVLVFMAEENLPRYVWAELYTDMLGSIKYPFKLVEVHPKWKVIQLGQPVMVEDIELIYDWRASVNGEIKGNFTGDILDSVNGYFP